MWERTKEAIQLVLDNAQKALQQVIKLFVYAFNRRQPHKQAAPAYQAHIIDFVYPCFRHSFEAKAPVEASRLHYNTQQQTGTRTGDRYEG